MDTKKAQSFEQVCLDVDWALLAEQKRELMRIQGDWVEGLLNLLDALQDSAVDYYGLKENHVFLEGLK